MRHEIIKISCDLCQKEYIHPKTHWDHIFGFSVPGGDPRGVRLSVNGIGAHVDHICEQCAESALVAVYGSMAHKMQKQEGKP